VRLGAYPNPAISGLAIRYTIDVNFDNAVSDVYDVLGKKNEL
jgi:hypothetical protein